MYPGGDGPHAAPGRGRRAGVPRRPRPQGWWTHAPFRYDSLHTALPPEAAMTPLQSLVAAGTKLWLDSVDPEEIARNRALGATGATSNPIIIADLVKTGRFDQDLAAFMKAG